MAKSKTTERDEQRELSRRALIKWSLAAGAALGVSRSRIAEILDKTAGQGVAAAAVELPATRSVHILAGNGGFAWFQLLFPHHEVAMSGFERQPHRATEGDRHSATLDAVAEELVPVDVLAATAPAAYPRRQPHYLGDQPLYIVIPSEIVSMASVVAEDPIAVLQGFGDSNCDGLLPDAGMNRPLQFSFGEKGQQCLLKVPNQQSFAVSVILWSGRGHSGDFFPVRWLLHSRAGF